MTTGLAVVFTVLQFRGISVEPVMTSAASQVIWRAALIAYFWCWRFGCIRDTDIQELVYVSMPNRGQWPLRSYGIVVLLIAVAIALVATEGNIIWFSIALTVFFVVDHVGWRHLVKVLAKQGKDSADAYTRQGELFDLERLRIVRAQIQGSWKWWRLSLGMMIILAIDATAFLPAFRSLLVTQIRILKPSMSISDAELFLYSMLVLVFVVTMEGWHYWIRLRTWISLDCIDDLSERYDLRRRRQRAEARKPELT
ncbi:hypothetical protein NML43_06200 [Rhodopseudomonas palustris]|uniref:hypothetical protein n=1 Tax=Rhodopseudomonas palustris TaxID=1076 RepID=UPI0020CD39FE|nr:hypothetical protein [Rhodopseudomonas palustris]MCP9626674.1 hypothetical protein [Rhodopseudomonas palustris]